SASPKRASFCSTVKRLRRPFSKGSIVNPASIPDTSFEVSGRNGGYITERDGMLRDKVAVEGPCLEFKRVNHRGICSAKLLEPVCIFEIQDGIYEVKIV
ncbi:MAG: hypothetical protein AAGD10_14585, partial [Myxococcota bacterium]